MYFRLCCCVSAVLSFPLWTCVCRPFLFSYMHMCVRVYVYVAYMCVYMVNRPQLVWPLSVFAIYAVKSAIYCMHLANSVCVFSQLACSSK